MEKKISELNSASIINANDSLVLNQDSETKKVSMSVLNSSLNIPTYIQIESPNISTYIQIESPNIPTYIQIESPNIPTYIQIESPNIPNIQIEPPPPMDVNVNWGTPPTLIANKSSGLVSLGTDVIFGNLKARIPSNGNKSLQVSTVSGSLSLIGSVNYVRQGVAGSYSLTNGDDWTSLPLEVSTTPTYLISIHDFIYEGDCGEWLLMDGGNSSAWKINFIIGDNNNAVISIEKLV